MNNATLFKMHTDDRIKFCELDYSEKKFTELIGMALGEIVKFEEYPLYRCNFSVNRTNNTIRFLVWILETEDIKTMHREYILEF